MKCKKAMLALSVSLAALTSCDLISKNQTAINPLLGEWKIDSIASKNNNDIGVLLMALSLQDKDSTISDLSFSSDSVLYIENDTLTKSAYTFNKEDKIIILLKDSSMFYYNAVNDSLITITSNDSTTLLLKKK